jgi:PAS domain S-box-containing protein
MSPSAPTIVIVDDAADVRSLVKTRLRLSRRFTVVGDGGDGDAAVELAREHRPSLLLLDVSMPRTDGLKALPQIRAVSPTTRVVMYSGFDEQGLADRALALGAAAFIEKSTSLDELIDRLTALSPAEVPTGPPEPRSATEASAADERVLGDHRERFREVFEEAAIGMATTTLSGRIVRANRALASLLGRPVGELIGTAYADLTNGRASLVASALDEVVNRGVDVAQVEHDVIGVPAGRRVLATLAPVRDSSGRPLYLFLQVQDITAQRGAEEELRRSEERFRLLVEAVQDYAIFMLSPDGIVISWNPGAERLQGYLAHEIVGQHFRRFYPPEVQAAKHPEHELEIAARDGRYEEEGWRIRKDGSRFWANVAITAIRNDRGQHIGFAKVTRDITARREAEEALRQSEERFRLLVEAVQDYAIFMLDVDGHIISWNRGAQRLKGYSASDIIGQHFRVFYPPEKQAEQHPEHELVWALRDGHYEEEGWRVRKDGSLFWANVVITAVRNHAGEHIGFTKVTRDMTERRAMTQELEAANARLRRAAAEQAEFLAVTAHELRTPVGVLGGSADMLSKHWAELTDDEHTELLESMASSAGRLRRLLGDLLTASRLQNSSLRLDPHRVDVETLLVAATVAARRTYPDAEFEVDAEPDLTVVADSDRLSQALDNLIGNALRHGASPVRVSATGEGPTVRICVTDSGAGVPAAMRSRLFERFTTGEAKGGTGLGLFIVRELARAHGGDASYEPGSPDHPAGAFVITLPAAGPFRPDGPPAGD